MATSKIPRPLDTSVVLYNNASNPLKPSAKQVEVSTSLSSLSGIKRVCVCGKIGDNGDFTQFIPIVNSAHNTITVTEYVGTTYYISVWITIDKANSLLKLQVRDIGNGWTVSNQCFIKKVIGYYC